jgi:hypothetical protein
MSKRLATFLFVVVVGVSFTASRSTTSPHPLRQTEQLALVAGNALPENIVNEIHSRGVAFRMDTTFRKTLGVEGPRRKTYRHLVPLIDFLALWFHGLTSCFRNYVLDEPTGL